MLLAMYKGPAKGFFNNLGRLAVCLFTRSKYSHCEIYINGIGYSSSFHDGGVRSKPINIYDGTWDTFEIQGDSESVKKWFKDHDQQPYDWGGIFRFVIPFIPQYDNRWFCNEACGEALGIKDSYKYTPEKLYERLVEGIGK